MLLHKEVTKMVLSGSQFRIQAVIDKNFPYKELCTENL